ncbi:MAG: TRAP transporter substrate-binding protein [Alphaproteobacteria bacterium]|nr:TRAP transporter substrate-binding protein [Alphaproteobacteria bacterium]
MTMRNLKIAFAATLMGVVLTLAVTNGSRAEVRFSSASPANVVTGVSVWIDAFANHLDKNGMKIKVYPIGTLGGMRETTDLLSQNLLEFCACGPFPLFKSAPVVLADLVPFMWKDADHQRRFVRSPGGLVEEVNKTSTHAGIRLLDWPLVSGPMGLFTVKKPVRSLADVSDLRLRFLAPPQKVLYEAIGAKGVGIPWSEVFTSLQTGVIDGYVQAPQVALMFRHTEIFKYFTRLNLGYASMPMIMSEEYYQSLSPNQRDIISDAVVAARRANDMWIEENVPLNLQRMKEQGIEIIELEDGAFADIKARILEAQSKMAPPPSLEYYLAASKKFAE